MDTEFSLHDYEKVRARLFCRLVRTDRPFLRQQTAYAEAFADLCAVPCIWEAGQGSPISLARAAGWGIDPAVLVQDAVENMRVSQPAVLEPLGDLMESRRRGSVRSTILTMLKRNFQDMPEGRLDQIAQILARRIGHRAQVAGGLNPMWVLGNATGRYGSSSVLYPGVLKSFSEKCKSSFYILPSSINDVILLPEGGAETREMLYEMVASANRKTVDEEIWLSDSVYYYNRENMEIRLF